MEITSVEERRSFMDESYGAAFLLCMRGASEALIWSERAMHWCKVLFLFWVLLVQHRRIYGLPFLRGSGSFYLSIPIHLAKCI